LRVIDDSGEDYLYPSRRFVVVEQSQAEEQKLLAAVGDRCLTRRRGDTCSFNNVSISWPH
jgi:hypothetical protein